MNREILFPTPIYIKMVKDPQKLNKYLYPLIKAWSKKNKGETKTNAGGGWHSPTDMNFKKEYKPLTDELFAMQEEIYKDYGMEPQPGLGNMWANINYPKSYNKQHMHPNCSMVGCLLCKSSRKTQEDYLLKIQDQDPILYSLEELKEYLELYGELYFILPFEGQMIMFPAWLPHGVEINESKEKGEKGWRVSVSFNFIQIDKERKVRIDDVAHFNCR